MKELEHPPHLLQQRPPGLIQQQTFSEDPLSPRVRTSTGKEKKDIWRGWDD